VVRADHAAETHIGVYRVLGVLGSGGMGTVVLAFGAKGGECATGGQDDVRWERR
jgi:hypothetical protein